MKKVIGILIVFMSLGALMFGVYSCNRPDDVIDFNSTNPSLRVGLSQTEIELDVDGASQIVSVAFAGKEYDSWEVISSEEWLTATKTTTSAAGKEEEAISISAPENTGYRRSGTVTVRVLADDKELEKVIEVDQVSALPDPVITAAEAVINFSSEAQEKSINITTNTSSWAANSNADWIAVTKESASIKVSVSANESDAMRTDTIYLIAGEAPNIASSQIVITQAKPDNVNEITINGIELILVRAGTFYMGAQSTDASGINYYASAAANQSPVHKVTITHDFYIGKYELTQAQYAQIMGTNPSQFVADNNPVEMVSYPMATQFTTLLSEASGKTFRLPTEAEWEYAARGGDLSKGTIYSGSNTLNDVANSSALALNETKPVGSFLPNELGIYDMSGNVYEWCMDQLQSYTAADVTDPVGVGTNRILRGGSWYHGAASHAVSYRGSNTDSFTRNYLGLRVVYVP
ncbi:MAG: SUMF1/EgtB/PvdO family nonheme iron enzyme [Niabella sp.]